MRRTITFGTKIALGTGTLAAALLSTALYGLHTISTLNDDFAVTVGQTVRKLQLAGIVNTASSDMAAGQRGMIMFTYAKNPALAASADQLFLQSSAKLQQAIAEMRPMAITEKGKQVLSQMDDNLSAWLAAYPEVKQLGQAGDADGAVRVLGERITPRYHAAGKQAEDL